MDIVSKIDRYEDRFRKNKYNGKGASIYKIEKGTIPIMISAPHAINHYREGKIKYADKYTGGIAYYLHKTYGCHLIYSASYSEADPNYDPIETSVYKRELRKYIENNDIKFLIDLHGCKAEKEFAVELGTINEENISLHGFTFLAGLLAEILTEELGEYLQKDSKIIQKNKMFSASNPNTITHYISQEVGIPAIQIEINKLYRDTANGVCLMRLINAFERYLMIIKGIDWSATNIAMLKVRKSDKHFPQDKVEINYADADEMSETDIIYAKTINGQAICTIHKGDKFEKGYAYLTNRLLEQLFQKKNYEKEILFLYKYDDKAYAIGRPIAGISKICFSPDIYETMDKNKQYILHPRMKGGCKMYVTPEVYPRGEKKVFIPRYYRLLMGIRDQDISKSYVQVLPGIETDQKEKNSLLKKMEEYFLNLFIGHTEIDMIVERPNDADDQNLIGRLSGDMMKVIGVTDNDKISIRFGGKEKSIKVLEGVVNHEEFSGKDEAFPDNPDMYIGIPAEIRSEIGVMPGDIVRVKRNKKHIFIRNFNQQLFAIFGTVLTIITLTENIMLRVIGAFIVVPFVVWITFAEERVKIERGKRKK